MERSGKSAMRAIIPAAANVDPAEKRMREKSVSDGPGS